MQSYLRLGASMVKAQTAQIKDEPAWELLDNALDDDVNLATVSVNEASEPDGSGVRPHEAFRQASGAHYLLYQTQTLITVLFWRRW